MTHEQEQLLKELVETHSPSGDETRVAKRYEEAVKPYADSIERDVMGQVHARLKARENAPSVLLAAHMDELGLMVHYIDDNGYLYVRSVGGIDPAVLPGLRVDLCATGTGKAEVLRGVMGRRPIHLFPAEERKEVTPLKKLFIDLGLPVEEVKRRVRIGDIAHFGVGFETFGEGLAVSRSFDDKMGVFVIARVMEELKKKGSNKGEVICSGTVQEEIGLRGGATTAYAIDADINIALDVSHATDYPSIDKSVYGDLKLGAGPIICRGPNINSVLFDRLVAAAEKAGISYQIEAEEGETGTDANPMQISRGGKVTGLISVPLRYMHTPTEVLALSDLDDTIALLVQFIEDLDAETSFIPQCM